MDEIIRPSTDQLAKYLKQWDSLDKYVLQESSIRKLFAETYPKNVHMDDVLIKVCSLNALYSTGILSPFEVAKRIVALNIDQRLSNRDKALVKDIALVTFDDQTTRQFYSFATKYCSHHLPDDYPIYDGFVEKMLIYFKDEDKFYNFKAYQLKDYPTYCDVLIAFRKFYGLENFTFKDIDRYLWQAGQESFPKQY